MDIEREFYFKIFCPIFKVIRPLIRCGSLTVTRRMLCDKNSNTACYAENNQLDYVRMRSLELIAEIVNNNKIEGQIAELGVYKGDFSRIINVNFPKKTLYLFDTFEGFDDRDRL